MWLLYHIYLDMYITSDIYRFVDVIKDIVRAFKFITMGVLNICPDTLRSPVELWPKVSDDLVKIARCAASTATATVQVLHLVQFSCLPGIAILLLAL